MNILSLLAGALVLILLILVPGYLTARLLFRDPAVFSTGERIFIPVVSGVLLVSWFGLALAEFGYFSLGGLALLLTVYSAAAAWFGRRAPLWWWKLGELRPDWILIAVTALAVLLMAKPAEYILGGYDAGVYVNIGVNIARTGAIAIHDPLVASLEPDPSRQFFWDLINPFMLYNQVRLPGFFVADLKSGLVLPQFLHLYPVWLAFFDAALGIQWGLYATPLLGVLSSIAFYFLVRALLGRRPALLAFFLLVILVPQFWFARYPVSEMMTQFLLLTGMYAFLRSRELGFGIGRDGVSGVGLPLIAGASFAAVFATRADSILLLAPIGLYGVAVILARQWGRAQTAFAASFGILFAYAVAHMWVFAPDYIYFQYAHFLRMKNIDKLLPGGGLPEADAFFANPLLFLALVVAAATAGLAALFLVDRLAQVLRRRWGARQTNALRRWLPVLRIAAALALVAVFAYAYFIWPRPSSPLAFIGGETTASRAGNLIKLGWYLSPIGIALAVLGGIAVLLRDLDRRNVFLYGTGAMFSVFFLEELYSNPHYIYTTRHYIPLVIPLFVLLAVRGLDLLWNVLPAWQPRLSAVARVCGAALLALWLAYNLYAMGIVDGTRAAGLAVRLPLVPTSTRIGPVQVEPLERSIVGFSELAGAYDEIAALAAQLDPNAVVILVNNRDEPALMATPLRFIYGRDTLVARFNQPNGEKVAALVDEWRAAGRPVVLMYGTNGGKLSVPRYRLDPYARFTLNFPQWTFAYQFMPRTPWPVSLSYALYRAEPESAPLAFPYRVDFTGDDYPALTRGFLERAPGEPSRRIGVVPVPGAKKPASLSAGLRFPLPPAGDTVYMTLTARAPADGIKLTIRSDKNELGSAVLGPEWSTLTLALPRAQLNREGETFTLGLVSGVMQTPDGKFVGAEFKESIVSDQRIAGNK